MADSEDKMDGKEAEMNGKEAKMNGNEAEMNGNETEKAGKNGKKASFGGTLTWVILAAVVGICTGAGFSLSRLLAGSAGGETVETSQPNQVQEETQETETVSASDSEGPNWYYELDPVVANLNVPGATRYVRATLILAMDSELKQAEGEKFLDRKKPVLVSRLTIYLTSQTLEDVTGEKNLRRIQSEILDAFNEKLFPDSRGMIRKILIKEFPIQ